MAKDKIAVRVNLRQNTNQKSDQYGHYYPYLDKNHTLSLRGLARHIADHGSIYTRDVVQGVLTQLSECIPWWRAEGGGLKEGRWQMYDVISSFFLSLKVRRPKTRIVE